MTLNIDELDIDNVAVGQTVNITSDAKEGQTFYRRGDQGLRGGHHLRRHHHLPRHRPH